MAFTCKWRIPKTFHEAANSSDGKAYWLKGTASVNLRKNGHIDTYVLEGF